MKPTRGLIVLLLLSFAVFCRAQDKIENLKFKAFKLAILQDEEGLSNLKNELDNVAESGLNHNSKARLYFLKAFTDYQPVFINYGQIENYMDVVSRVKRNLDSAITRDQNLAEARTLKAIITLGALPPGKALDAVREDITEIQKLKNGKVYANFVTAFAKAFTPSGGAEEFELAIKGMEQLGMTDNNWWYWSANAWLADVYLGNFRRAPDYDKGYKILSYIKQMQPNAGCLRVIDHFSKDQTSRAFSKEPKVSWSLLATDSVGDARDPQKMLGLEQGGFEIFDVKKLFYALDFSNGIVWFKFEYETFPSENFGINIFLDVDGNDENGNLFFSNREFRHDIAGTLWLRKVDGKYIGVNGLATGHDFARRRMVAKKEGAFEFYVDKEKKTLIVGVAHEYLGYPQSIKVFATTGTYQNWEDNIPDKGGVDINP